MPLRRLGYFGSLFLAALLGLYLTGAHAAGGAVACPSSGIVDCRAVLSGPGSVVAGVPLAGWGALWAIAGAADPWWSPAVRLAWRVGGLAGLAWAWTHEIRDGRLCLWCSGLQLLVLIGLSLAGPGGGARRLWRGIRRLWAHPARGSAGAAGLVAAGAFAGYQAWLGTDTWGVVVPLAILWGGASAWGLLLWWTRRPVSRPGRLAAGAGGVPLTVAAGAAATACTAGVCAAGASAASLGVAGLLAAVFGVFAPLAVQGLAAVGGIAAAAVWTYRRGAAG